MKFIYAIFLFTVMISLPVFTQENPNPSPIQVEFKLLNDPGIGEEAEISLTVSIEKMTNMDIQILIPNALSPIHTNDYQTVPARIPPPHQSELGDDYKTALQLCRGILGIGHRQEFKIKIPMPENAQKLIAIVEAFGVRDTQLAELWIGGAQ